MPSLTFEMPFTRTVRLAAVEPGGSPYRAVVERLGVTVPVAGRTRPVARATNRAGDELGLRIVHEGRVYGGDPAAFTGLTPSEALARSEAEQRARHVRGGIPPGAALAEDGREAQEVARHAAEASSLVAGGRVYRRATLPSVVLSMDYAGSVAVSTECLSPGSERAAWMRFPIDREDEAMGMAERLVASVRDLDRTRDWSRWGDCAVRVTDRERWTVIDAASIAEVSFAEGGPGTDDERDAAMARDLVHLLAPHVGHYDPGTVIAFAELRLALDRGGEVRDLMDGIVRTLVDEPVPERVGAVLAQDLKTSAFCLDVRLSGFELRQSHGMRP